MKKNKIILYGHFGSGNIGNDSSFEAVLYKVKQYCPNADIVCVCENPREIERRFEVESVPISGPHAEQKPSSGVFSRVMRLGNRLLDEIFFLLKHPSWFVPGDKFIIVGTGAVDDMAVHRPWHTPYELYKWCKVAKAGSAQVIFLSVGVGPIVNRISRFLMLRALKMADYRSYRETAAFDYLHSLRYDTTGDLLYPDLVFSLPKELLPSFEGVPSAKKVIGLGLINYYGWRHDPSVGEAVYQKYLSKIKRFAVWLLEKGFSIRIIFGDSDDRRPVDELEGYLRATVNLESASNQLIVEKILTASDLFGQIIQTDLVVASRFHNVLCSLMLEKPVISLGYHVKNDLLMWGMGLGQYCQRIEQFTHEQLVTQFEMCISESSQITDQIHGQLETYRKMLEEQYKNILS